MAKYYISYTYYKIDSNGRPTGKTATSRTVEATSDQLALQIIKSKHPGCEIDIQSIRQQ